MARMLEPDARAPWGRGYSNHVCMQLLLLYGSRSAMPLKWACIDGRR